MSKRISRLIIVTVASMMILACGICVNAAITTPIKIVGSGQCGTNATWSLDEQGLLTISGTGVIDKWVGDPNKCLKPGTTQYYPVTSLKIENGITGIGNEMFHYWSGLKGDLTIPDSVEYIGAFAFEQCTGLDGKITIGDGVKRIYPYAFCGCNSVKTLKLGKKIEWLDDGAFESCDALSGILIVPESLKELGGSVFTDCGFSVMIFEGEAPDCESPTIPASTKIFYYPEKAWWGADEFPSWIEHECLPLYSLSEEVSKVITFSSKVPERDKERIIALSNKIQIKKTGAAALSKDKIAVLARAIPNVEELTGYTWDDIMDNIKNNPGSGYNLEAKVQTIVEVTASDLDNKTTPYLEYSLTPILYVWVEVPGKDKISGEAQLYADDFSNVPISVTMPLGTAFTPKTIEHTSKDGKEIYEVFTQDGVKTFSYDPVGMTVSIQVGHFSNIRISGQPKQIVETGDSNDIALYGVLAILSLVGAGFVCKRRKCEKNF